MAPEATAPAVGLVKPVAAGSSGSECLVDRLVSLFEVGTCVLDERGTILAANAEWTELVATARLPAGGCGAGTDFFDFAARVFEPGLAQRVGAAVREVLADRQGHTSLRGTWHPGRERRHLVIRVNRITEHGRARAFVRFVDNTEWSQTQEALREATSRASMLALVAEHTRDTVVITDAAGRIEWANAAFCELTGFAREDVLGTLHGAFDRTSEVGQGPAFAEAGVRPDPDGSVDVTVRGRSRHGRDYWSHVLIQPIREYGRTVRWVVVGRDVTAQRWAAEQLRESGRQARALAEALAAETSILSGVVSAIPHLVYWKDGDLRYAGVNEAFLTMRGFDSTVDVLGRTEDELGAAVASAAEVSSGVEPGGVGPGGVDALAGPLAEAERTVMAGAGAVAERRVTVELGGRVRHLVLTVLPRTVGRTAAGTPGRVAPGTPGSPAAGTPAGEGDDAVAEVANVAGVIGVATDVTEVSELERQLAQASRLESIGQLAAGVAHEINTPLQYVTTNTEFLLDNIGLLLAAARRGAPEGRERAELDFVVDEVPIALAQSREGLERVTRIVRALKDFSHMGEGRSTVDLNRVVESTAQISTNEWKYVAELELDLDPEVGAVQCFEGELKQALLNLVVNAAQAIEGERRGQGSAAAGQRGRITVTTRRGERAVTITVADDGPGIPADVLPRVFDPFFTTKAVGKGTGQGLSLAYASVVTRHGGALDVSSRPGVGTSFTITLPLRLSD